MSTKRVIKIKKTVAAGLDELPTVPIVPKVFKIKKSLPVPPPPPHGLALTLASEAFEALREYRADHDEPISNDDIVWFQAELDAEKKDHDEFWSRCGVTKALMEATINGITDEVALMKIELDAKAAQKKLPIRKEDIGPMPTHGTPEFWAWCHKRKKLRLQEEAAAAANH